MNGVLVVTKALSDESRLRILAGLSEAELCLSQFTKVLGLAPSTVSEHLHLPAEAGLVTARKQGRRRYYSLADTDTDTSPCAARALRWLRESGVTDRGTVGRPLEDDAKQEKPTAQAGAVWNTRRRGAAEGPEAGIERNREGGKPGQESMHPVSAID